MLFAEPVFVLYCCIIEKLGEREISLLKYFDGHVEHIKGNISDK